MDLSINQQKIIRTCLESCHDQYAKYCKEGSGDCLECECLEENGLMTLHRTQNVPDYPASFQLRIYCLTEAGIKLGKEKVEYTSY